MIAFGYGVSLETIDAVHLPQLRQWRNDYRIYRWCRQDGLISEYRHVEWFKWQAADPHTRMFLVCDTKTPVGVAGLTSIDLLNRRAEFSLYIDPEKHHSGYGKKALCTLLHHGFVDLALNRVWGETFEGNPALRMFLNLGLEYEGTRKQHYFKEGRFIDSTLVAITRNKWTPQSFLSQV